MTLNHIGIIPDGNRRYGEKYGLSLQEAYVRGIEKLKEVLGWSQEQGIRILTAWGFSTENFERSVIEKRIFFSLLEKKIKDLISSGELEKNKIKIKIIGRNDFFSKSLKELFNTMENLVKAKPKLQLNLALGYGGRQEIVDACNQILEHRLKNITQRTFSKYLYTNQVPDPELIIRTSGEQRLSGFFPWQCVYSEIIFLKPLWPELKKRDFTNAIKEFENRKRRFGK